MTSKEDTRMLTTGQAAEYIGVSVRSLAKNWAVWGLKPYRVGRRNVYRAADLERWLKAKQISSPQRPRRAA